MMMVLGIAGEGEEVRRKERGARKNCQELVKVSSRPEKLRAELCSELLQRMQTGAVTVIRPI